MSEAELDAILVEVAGAVGLQEGDAGVRRVLRAVQHLGNASTRAVSREIGLPLPIVAAVNNELRKRGVLSTDRPSRLTARGSALLGDPDAGAAGTEPDDAAGAEPGAAAGIEPPGTAGSGSPGTAGIEPRGAAGSEPRGAAGSEPRGVAGFGRGGAAGVEATCDCCGGHGVRLPAELAGLPDRLADLIQSLPAVDLTLDQAYCTVDTKVRRLLLMLHYGLLPSRGLLLVGDDDLMSLTVVVAGAMTGRPLVERLGVVDISPEMLDFIQDRLTDLEFRAELVEQDLREPLDERLRGRFDLAMTDPPYTTEGARLFLSRAVEGLGPGPGRSIVFSFGPKGPDDALRVQETVTELGLAVNAMHRDFNEYLGAGVIGSRSHLQYLSTTARSAPVVDGTYAGLLYTAQKRAADRRYLCLECGSKYLVGPNAQWHTIADLKDAGCLNCGGRRFRPLQLVRTTPS